MSSLGASSSVVIVLAAAVSHVSASFAAILAQRGARVVLNLLPDQQADEPELSSSAIRVTRHQLKDFSKVIDYAISALGRIDALVVHIPNESSDITDLKAWDAEREVGLKAAYRVIKT